MRQLNIAYLILAHHQPDQLAHLIRTLQCEEAHFFIHIDAKSDEGAFRRVIPNIAKITFVPDRRRVKVFWGGYSVVDAQRALMELALASDHSFARYCLLSGADFPITSLKSLQNELTAPTEFMCIWKKLDSNRTPRHTATLKHVTRLHLVDNYWLNEKTTPAPRAAYFMRILLRRIPIARPTFPIYVGSQWWALSEECIRYVHAYLDENPNYTALFRHSLCPDEMFFQTIVMNSPFRQRVIHNYSESDNPEIQYTLKEHGCHYIDWTAAGVSLPKVLAQSDFDSLLNSSMLFARKFDSATSAQLLVRLEREVLNGAVDVRQPGPSKMRRCEELTAKNDSELSHV